MDWLHTHTHTHRVFHNHWNKAAAYHLFSVDLILFLFSDYCWEIVNILLYSTEYSEIVPSMMELKIFYMKTYYKTLSRLFEHDKETSSISTHFQTRVRFSSWSRTLKVMALLKILEQQFPHHLGFQSPRKNVRALLTTLYATFNSTFNWIANI